MKPKIVTSTVTPTSANSSMNQAQRPLVISSCAAPPVAARSTLSRNAPSLFATTAQNGKVKGLVMKVTSVDSGTLARAGSAMNAARKICPTGMMKLANTPSATPRGTLRRVKRHSSGVRNRCAIGWRYLLRAICSRVGMRRRSQSASAVFDLRLLIATPLPCAASLAVARARRKGLATNAASLSMWLTQARNKRARRPVHPRSRINRALSRFQSRSLIVWRLSCACLPLARASSTLARPVELK